MTRGDKLRKLLSYAIVGGLAAIVDLGVFAALYGGTQSRFGSAALSFMVAALVNYGLSSIFVFRNALSFRRLRMFFAVAAIGFTINVSVTLIASSLLQLDPRLGKLCGIAVAFLFNNVLNRHVVFAQVCLRPALPMKDVEPA